MAKKSVEKETTMQEKIAHILLKTRAVALSPAKPFTFSSGIKSPIYCDNRKLLGFPKERKWIIDAFVQQVSNGNYGAIVGTATAGIPWSAWVAEALSLPMAYVRSAAKKHGKNQQIEGIVTSGQKIALFEDLISTGGSVYTAYEALQSVGVQKVDIFAIFTYSMESSKALLQGVQVTALSTFLILLECAREDKYISAEEYAVARAWHDDPLTYYANTIEKDPH